MRRSAADTHTSPRRLLVLFALLLTLPTLAAPPTIDALSPSGAQQGTTVQLTASGTFPTWPPQVWTDTPSLKIEPAKTKGTFTATLAPGTPPGPHLVRFYTPDGPSAPRVFVVGQHPELAETEPNDAPAQAQKVASLPITFNAQLDKSGDVDSYAVRLDAGQTLVASVCGNRLGSPIDPLLHLLGPDGRQAAFAHDGLGLDPLLVHRAVTPGVYLVRVAAFPYPPAADVKFTGGKSAVYRLSVTTGPFPLATNPSGVKRGTKATLRLLGPNCDNQTVTLDASTLTPTDDHLTIPGGDATLHVPVTDAHEQSESELSLTPAPLVPPVAVTGALAKPAEEDGFPFTATKGQKLTITVRSLAPTYALDPALRLLDASGKLVASDDGAGTGQAKLDFTAPAAGPYRVTLSDLFHKGSSDLHYRLEIRPTQPTLTATVTGDAYTLTPGKPTAIKVTLAKRPTPAAPLLMTAADLPPGVTGLPVPVPEKATEASLTLTAEPDAKPGNHPFRIVLSGTKPQPGDPPLATVTASLRKETDKTPAGLVPDQTADLWLTVLPKPK